MASRYEFESTHGWTLGSPPWAKFELDREEQVGRRSIRVYKFATDDAKVATQLREAPDMFAITETSSPKAAPKRAVKGVDSDA